MLPLVERELVDKGRYLDEQEFLDATAVAQAAPGILAINIAILSEIGRASCRERV